jgi:hypothetical protein
MATIHPERGLDFMLRYTILFVALFIGFAGTLFAADTANQSVQLNVDEVCVIAVTGDPAALNITAPATGGQPPASASDNSTYAQYTSVVCGAAKRSLTANWGGADAAPSGCSLSLEVTSLTAGCGSIVVGGITVSSMAQNIVTTIGSCATGTGATDGAQLTYTLGVSDHTQLDSCDDQTVTITLTLTDAS